MNHVCRIIIAIVITISIAGGCSKDPEKEFDELNNKSVALFKEKKYEESKKAGIDAIKLAEEHFGPNSPKLATVLFNQACNHLVLKEFNLARPLFAKALKINKSNFGKTHPEVANIINYQALMYYKEGNLAKAIAHYQKAYDILIKTLGIHPAIAGICNNMGAIYNIQGQYEKAEKCYQTALEIRPDDQYLKKALSINDRDKKNIDATVASVKEELEKRPESDVLAWRLGNLYKNKKENDKALTYYEKAIELNKKHPEAFFEAANLYMEKGEDKKALTYFQKVTELRPSQYSALYNIARIFAKKDNKNEAIKWLKTAVENGYYDWEYIQNDKYMDSIRAMKEFKEIKQAHLNTGPSGAGDDA